MEQQTVAKPFTLAGIGIHTGASCCVNVLPAPAGTGRVFRVAGVEIPARADFVVDTRRSTTLGIGTSRIQTVEHLLSAMMGCGIDNVWIETEGPEVPILDGSALVFVEAILAAGLLPQGRRAREVRPDQTFTVTEGASSIRVEPYDGFRIEVCVEFEHWPEGNASAQHELEEAHLTAYATHVAPARTFAFRKEIEMLLAAGLALGGSLDNALVITPPDGFSSDLRLPYEWAVHKLMDLIGDLALVDARLRMAVTASRPGHSINTTVANQIIRLQTERLGDNE